jgi:hypothetical protein
MPVAPHLVPLAERRESARKQRQRPSHRHPTGQGCHCRSGRGTHGTQQRGKLRVRSCPPAYTRRLNGGATVSLGRTLFAMNQQCAFRLSIRLTRTENCKKWVQE